MHVKTDQILTTTKTVRVWSVSNYSGAGRENRTPRSTVWKTGARPLRLSTRIILYR